MDYQTNFHYQRPNKFFLSCLGLWPHQTAREKRLYFLLSIFFVITQGFLQFGGIMMAWHDADIFLESIPPVAIDLVCYIKLLNFIYNADKMKNLLSIIEEDWARFKGCEELTILRDFGYICRNKTLTYAAAVYGSMAPFMLAPLLTNIAALLMDQKMMVSNETIARPLMFHVEYLINVEKWYYYLLLHSYFGTIVYITIVVAIDTMLLAYVYHACSLFAIIGYRLEHLVNDDVIDVNINPPLNEDKAYRNIIDCITEHRLVIEYVDILESANTMSLLLQLGINVLCLSFTGFQAVRKIENPQESIRYVSFLVAQSFSVFYASYPSQCLLTESTRISDYFTRTAWYLTSMRTRKLLNLMILRSTRPCYLTAGNFYLLDMEFFATIMRVSMSYLTMLCSIS